jgi:hypothetical protein
MFFMGGWMVLEDQKRESHINIYENPLRTKINGDNLSEINFLDRLFTLN